MIDRLLIYKMFIKVKKPINLIFFKNYSQFKYLSTEF